MIDPPRSEPFRVLFVCTANLCRSPLAQFLLAREVGRRGLDWEVASAGTDAVAGVPMDPSARHELERRSIEVGPWVSRRLDAATVDWADLILTAGAGHRAAVVRGDPSALLRTFPVLQFSRYAALATTVRPGARGSEGEALLRGVLAARPRIPPSPPGHDDIADPIGRRPKAFQVCATTIETAIASMLRPLDA